jgi:D-glycero-alpha-D-manno-heptose-7-phosphate kinase
MVITKTPYRISFFGGGTDLNHWFKDNGGSVLSTSIDKYCYISCRYLPKFFEHKFRFVYSKIEDVKEIEDIKHPAIKGILQYLELTQGIELHHDGDLPARSGLGSSSSFTVGLLNTIYALWGRHISKFDLASQAIHIEQNVLKEYVGCQDQVAAAYGGFNRIDFSGENSFNVTPIVIAKPRIDQLQNNLMLFFTGVSRFASEIEKSKIENFHAKKLELRKMQEMVPASIKVLTDPDINLDDFGYMLNDTWEYKKMLSSKVSSSEIDQIYNTAMSSGAIGGKLLGAGGGGFILFYVPQEKQETVKQNLSHLIHVPFRFENFGSTVALYQPNGL